MMTTRLARMTVTALLLAGTAACGLGGGGMADACDAPVDDEPTTFAVSSSDLDDPDLIRGCIDSNSDTDTFDLTGQDIGTGTFNIRCFAETGVAEFDTPTSSDFVACLPGGTTFYNHNEVTPTDLIVRAQGSGTGGEYRLEVVVA